MYDMLEFFSNIVDKIRTEDRCLGCLAEANSVKFLTEPVSPVFSASPARSGSMPGKLATEEDQGTLVLTRSVMLFGSPPGFFLIFKSLKVMLVKLFTKRVPVSPVRPCQQVLRLSMVSW